MKPGKFFKYSTGVAIILLVITYFISVLTLSQGEYNRDNFLKSKQVAANQDEVGLNLSANEIDVQNGVFSLTATPQLSGTRGVPLKNGSFFLQQIFYSFDVFTGPTLVDPGAGELVGGKPVSVRLEGNSENYPFDKYQAKFVATALMRGTDQAPVGLHIRDNASSISGYKINSRYLAFDDESLSKSKIKEDRAQGLGLIQWRISRSNSAIYSVFLLALLMIVGGFASVLMTFSVAKGARPPSVGALIWLAAFLFALFQVRDQLPGTPPIGIRFDTFIFFPTILLLVLLILVNVLMWDRRDDWDMENPIFAVRGKRKDVDQ
jgi:hypothetical protein